MAVDSADRARRPHGSESATKGPPSRASKRGNDYDVLVLGAGYAGMMAALRLSRRAPELRVALVNYVDEFVERIRQQEEMVAPVRRRIPSLSTYLEGTGVDFVQGEVRSLDPERCLVTLTNGGRSIHLSSREIIYALGSRVDTENAPGAADHAFRLDPGNTPRATVALREALAALGGGNAKIVVVGGGALSVEAAGEVKSVWPAMQVTLISAERAGNFAGSAVEEALRRDLLKLGVELIDEEPVKNIRARDVVTVKNRRFAFDLCIWAAGMRAPSIAREAGIACGNTNRILVGPNLRSISHPLILACGDSAEPLAPTGAPYRPSALAAAVSGAYAADEVNARRAGKPLRSFSFSTFAQAVAIGRFGAVFPLGPNDRQILFVVAGRAGRHLRAVLVWLVLFFLKFERLAPGLQSWPGRRRVSAAEAETEMARRAIEIENLAHRAKAKTSPVVPRSKRATNRARL